MLQVQVSESPNNNKNDYHNGNGNKEDDHCGSDSPEEDWTQFGSWAVKSEQIINITSAQQVSS